MRVVSAASWMASSTVAREAPRAWQVVMPSDHVPRVVGMWQQAEPPTEKKALVQV